MDNLLNLFSQYGTNNPVAIPILLLGAFIAGIIASLSPCSLGFLPLIIGYVGGYAEGGNKKIFIQMLSFSLGLSLILSIIGVICALTGRAFAGFTSPIIMLIFASVIVILGLNLIGFLEINFPSIIKKMPQNKTGSLFIFPFLIGTVFALASSPCSSPILAAIMAIAAVSSNIAFSISLLFCFALGQCGIIIFFALFTSTLKNMSKFIKYSEMLIKISGIILILAGLYIYYIIFSGMT